MPTPVSREAIAELRRARPRLPDDYLEYLANVGWGETVAGPMIYERPLDAAEIFGPRDDLIGIVVLGDDFQGYCLGFNTEANCYGELSENGTWEPWPRSDRIESYVNVIE